MVEYAQRLPKQFPHFQQATEESPYSPVPVRSDESVPCSTPAAGIAGANMVTGNVAALAKIIVQQRHRTHRFHRNAARHLHKT